MKRHLSLAICTVVVVGLFAAGVANAAIEIKVGHIAPLFHGQTKGVESRLPNF